MLTDTVHLFYKYLIISLRTPLWSLFNLIQPLIWLIIFGQLFSRMAQLPGFPADSYVAFFVPGVVIMTVLFGSSWSGVSLLREINSGAVDKMLVAPIHRASIVLSRVLHSAIQVLAQSLIIIVVSAFFGAELHFQIVNALLGLIIVVAMGVGFAALSNGLAIVLQREEPLVVMGNLMTLPLMFFSSALVPKEFMPSWISAITNINPVHYGVEGVRGAFFAASSFGSLLLNVAVAIGFAVIALLWAVSAFNRLRE